MKPPPFEYHDPTTIEEAIDLLGRYGTEAGCSPVARALCRSSISV
jgi:hypothetical protein